MSFRILQYVCTYLYTHRMWFVNFRCVSISISHPGWHALTEMFVTNRYFQIFTLSASGPFVVFVFCFQDMLIYYTVIKNIILANLSHQRPREAVEIAEMPFHWRKDKIENFEGLSDNWPIKGKKQSKRAPTIKPRLFTLSCQKKEEMSSEWSGFVSSCIGHVCFVWGPSGGHEGS